MDTMETQTSYTFLTFNRSTECRNFRQITISQRHKYTHGTQMTIENCFYLFFTHHRNCSVLDSTNKWWQRTCGLERTNIHIFSHLFVSIWIYKFLWLFSFPSVIMFVLFFVFARDKKGRLRFFRRQNCWGFNQTSFNSASVYVTIISTFYCSLRHMRRVFYFTPSLTIHQRGSELTQH